MTKDLVVVKVLFPPKEPGAPTRSAEDVWTHLQRHINGRHVQCTDDELSSCTDWAKVRRYYKLGGASTWENLQDKKAQREEADAVIIGAMALRGV
jgi:EKC/KEOPS complex subunit CGI121/TPRKB